MERLLKLLTFLPLSTIEEVMSKQRETPETRSAQHLLASEFLDLVHGPEVKHQAAREYSNRLTQRTTISISEHISRLKAEVEQSTAAANLPEYENVQSPSVNKRAPQTSSNNAPLPTIDLPRSMVEEASFPTILKEAGLVNSRSEGQRLINNKGAYVGGKTGEKHELQDELSWTYIKGTHAGAAKKWIVWGNDDKGLLLLRVGKWKIKVVNVIPDAEDILGESQRISESEDLTIPPPSRKSRDTGGDV